MTVSDAQGNIICNPETVTHTSSRKSEQKLLSNRTISVLPLSTNPGIEQEIAPIILAPQTLLTPVTKEVVTEAALGGAWIHRTTRQVIRTGVNGSTPDDIRNAIGIVEPSSPVLIGIVGTFPPYGINLILGVRDKHQSTSPGLVRKYQKLDPVVDRKLSNDRDLTSTFSKVIGDKISDSSSRNL